MTEITDLINAINELKEAINPKPTIKNDTPQICVFHNGVEVELNKESNIWEPKKQNV